VSGHQHRCTCCRRWTADTPFTITVPRGFIERICLLCADHVQLQRDGTVHMPRPCPRGIGRMTFVEAPEW
jgi:hypothetical protein